MTKEYKNSCLTGSWKKVFFLGIGGIGMSALARYLQSKEITVIGYDRTPTPLTEQLENEGISVFFNDNPLLIPIDSDAVIYTPAVPRDTRIFQWCLSSGKPMIKRAALLGKIANDNKLLAVAGTHGKTTVSSMLAHILSFQPGGCNGILGGILKNTDSNLLLAPDSMLFVTEADEFDRSFLHLFPWLAVITSTDADHLDVYENHAQLMQAFSVFTSQVRPEGKLLVKAGIDLNKETDSSVETFTYALDGRADFLAANICLTGNTYRFDLVSPQGIIHELELGIPGLMNVENAVAASAAALLSGANRQTVRRGLESYQGVNRRFDVRINRHDFVYIDDYAHHPAEIKACIHSAKNLFPEKKITGVFQPHLYSRTRDFAEEFARSLEMLDTLVLLDIYPARELSIPGVTSELIFDSVRLKNKFLIQKDELTGLLLYIKPQVLITMGAGDIDRLVKPLEDAFNMCCR